MITIIMLLTPESVNRDECGVGRWGRISKRQSNVIPRREHFGNGNFHDVVFHSSVDNIEISLVELPDGIRPSLDRTIDQATIHPWSNLVQLHPGVVGMVPSSKVVAIAKEWNLSVGTAFRIKEGVALGNSHVLVLGDTSRPLGIKHLLNNLLACGIESQS
jgi:hypothetical protein